MGRCRTRYTPGVRRVRSYHSWRTPPARFPTVSRVASAPIAAEFRLTVQCPTSLFSLGLSHGDFRSEGSRVCVARHGFGECPIALLTPRIRGGLTCRTSRPLHRVPDASHVRPSRVSGGAQHSSFRSLRLPRAPPAGKLGGLTCPSPLFISQVMEVPSPDGPLPGIPGKRCAHCNTQTTPLWRNGPDGPKTLCNACGVRDNRRHAKVRPPSPQPWKIFDDA